MTKSIGMKLAAACLLLAAAPAAHAVVVFGPASCGGVVNCADLSPINQDFGDTAEVGISYRSATAPGNTATVASRPWRYSDGGLSGGNGAYVLPSGSAPGLVAEFRLDLLTAGTVTLGSVDFGTVLGSPETLQYYVYDSSWNPLTSGSVLLSDSALAQVVLNLSSTTGLILQFGTASLGGGIQNIDFSYSAVSPPPPVPEPASWAMMLAGFGLIGMARRRRTWVAA